MSIRERFEVVFEERGAETVRQRMRDMGSSATAFGLALRVTNSLIEDSVRMLESQARAAERARAGMDALARASLSAVERLAQSAQEGEAAVAGLRAELARPLDKMTSWDSFTKSMDDRMSQREKHFDDIVRGLQSEEDATGRVTGAVRVQTNAESDLDDISKKRFERILSGQEKISGKALATGVAFGVMGSMGFRALQAIEEKAMQGYQELIKVGQQVDEIIHSGSSIMFNESTSGQVREMAALQKKLEDARRGGTSLGQDVWDGLTGQTALNMIDNANAQSSSVERLEQRVKMLAAEMRKAREQALRPMIQAMADQVAVVAPAVAEQLKLRDATLEIGAVEKQTMERVIDGTLTWAQRDEVIAGYKKKLKELQDTGGQGWDAVVGGVMGLTSAFGGLEHAFSRETRAKVASADRALKLKDAQEALNASVRAGWMDAQQAARAMDDYAAALARAAESAASGAFTSLKERVNPRFAAGKVRDESFRVLEEEYRRRNTDPNTGKFLPLGMANPGTPRMGYDEYKAIEKAINDEHRKAIAALRPKASGPSAFEIAAGNSQARMAHDFEMGRIGLQGIKRDVEIAEEALKKFETEWLKVQDENVRAAEQIAKGRAGALEWGKKQREVDKELSQRATMEGGAVSGIADIRTEITNLGDVTRENLVGAFDDARMALKRMALEGKFDLASLASMLSSRAFDVGLMGLLNSAGLGYSGGKLPGAQAGADFVVPGSGGPDSKLLAMRVSPGERVKITPQGQGGQNATGKTVVQVTHSAEELAMASLAAAEVAAEKVVKAKLAGFLPQVLAIIRSAQ